MKLHFKIILVLIFAFFSCNSSLKKKENQSKANSITNQAVINKALDTSKFNSVIDGAIGVITTSKSYEFGDIIDVFDINKNKINQIKIVEEYQILALSCLSNDNNYFKVKLENGQIGYISKDSKKIVFESWQEHILKLFSVGFNPTKNPLLKKPNENSDTINFDKDEFYLPNKIQGEWLELKWGPEKNLNYGWIKWKEDNKIIIEFFYFA